MRGDRGTFNLLPVLFAAVSATAAQAAEPEADGTFVMRGMIGAEVRAFAMRPSYAGQDRAPLLGSLTAAANASWTSNDKSVVIDVAPFLRYDDTDRKRTHADLREAAVNVYGQNVDLRLGVSKVYWGVTESRHIVDIVNQSDLVEEPEGDEKLGQPMAMLRGQYDDVEATVVVLPLFRPRTFPGITGRLRMTLPVDTGNAEYESSARTHRLDVAGRLKARIDDFDIGLTYFNGTSREPRFELAGATVVPVYDVIDQVGLDVQATLEATLLKLEAISRDGHQGPGARRFTAVVAGVEHTLSQVAGTNCDVGLVLEFTWDDRPPSAPPTIYDKDFFFGTRFALNDTSDSSGLIGALVDLDKGSVYAKIEASTRLGDAFRLDVQGALILRAGDGDTVLEQVRDDSFLTVRLLHFL